GLEPGASLAPLSIGSAALAATRRALDARLQHIAIKGDWRRNTNEQEAIARPRAAARHRRVCDDAGVGAGVCRNHLAVVYSTGLSARLQKWRNRPRRQTTSIHLLGRVLTP